MLIGDSVIKSTRKEFPDPCEQSMGWLHGTLGVLSKASAGPQYPELEPSWPLAIKRTLHTQLLCRFPVIPGECRDLGSEAGPQAGKRKSDPQ